LTDRRLRRWWIGERLQPIVVARMSVAKLIVYVELWERAVNKTIPGEVVARLGVREAELMLQYDDLEQTFDKLRAELSAR
jgi:hypothetical protein